MKLPLTALLGAALTTGALADNTGSGTFLVPNPHGGYNVIQSGGPPKSIPLFGPQGYVAKVIQEDEEPDDTQTPAQASASGQTLPSRQSYGPVHKHAHKYFILRPVVQDDGHGNKHTVYKKVYYATRADAEAALANQ